VLLTDDDDARLVFGAALGLLGGIERCPEVQRDLLVDLAAVVYGIDLISGPLSGFDTATFLAADPSPAVREQAVNLLVLAEFADRELEVEEAMAVERFADAVGIHSTFVHDARHLARGHRAIVYADLQRQSWYAQETKREIGAGRLVEVAGSKLAYTGFVADEAIARKWRGLTDMPEGSWGREVAEFYRRHGFPFPGERHGIYEIGARHDFVHVLTDDEASPEGELDVFAFIAAAMPDARGLSLLAVTLGIFQNGAIRRVMGKRVKMARTDTLQDPGATLRWADAFRRGRACGTDVMGGIDHFALAPLPLDEVRLQLNVIPKGVD